MKAKIEIAETCVALVSQSDEWHWLDAPDFTVFSSGSPPDITIQVYVDGELPEVPVEDRVFTSQARNIYMGDWGWALELRRPAHLPIPFSDQLLKLDAELSAGELHISETDADRQPSLLLKALFEPLWGKLLTLHRGVLVHASCISFGPGGILFVGAAGAGKTTMANLWEYHDGSRILHDDRVVVREKNGEFWAYPAPRLASFGPTSSSGVRLEHVFFISHGDRNVITPRWPSSAVTGLLAESMVPSYDPPAIGAALHLLGDLTACVPCDDLAFLPDESAVDFISGFCLSEATPSA